MEDRPSQFTPLDPSALRDPSFQWPAVARPAPVARSVYLGQAEADLSVLLTSLDGAFIATTPSAAQRAPLYARARARIRARAAARAAWFRQRREVLLGRALVLAVVGLASSCGVAVVRSEHQSSVMLEDSLELITVRHGLTQLRFHEDLHKSSHGTYLSAIENPDTERTRIVYVSLIKEGRGFEAVMASRARPALTCRLTVDPDNLDPGPMPCFKGDKPLSYESY